MRSCERASNMDVPLLPAATSRRPNKGLCLGEAKAMRVAMPSCVRMSVCAPALRVLFGLRLEVTCKCCFVAITAFVVFACSPGDAVGTRGKRFVSERTANMLQRCFASLHLASDHIIAAQPCLCLFVSVCLCVCVSVWCVRACVCDVTPLLLWRRVFARGPERG